VRAQRLLGRQRELNQVFRKLDVTSRTQLAERLP
jgi:hypothetical protein